METAILKHGKIILKVIAVSLIFGGAVRLFANKILFELFSMGELWMQEPYSIYIYKVLGAFVVFTGFIFWIISRNPEQYREMLIFFAFGFIFIGIVMSLAGIILNLPLKYYLPDPLYCFLVGGVLLKITK